MIKYKLNNLIAFQKIFASEKHIELLKKILLKKTIFKESFELFDKIRHKNSEEEKLKIDDLFILMKNLIDKK